MNSNDSSTCPSFPRAKLYAEEFKNYSSVWNNSDLFQHYLCDAAQLHWIRETCNSYDGHMRLVMGLVGLFSALGSIITLSRHEFSNCLGYLMYKIIAYLELLHMIVIILVAFHYFLECEYDFTCQSISAYFSAYLTNTFSEAVDFLILFLCIERCMACLTPVHFKKIHQRRVFRSVVAIALIMTASMNAAKIFQLRTVYSEKLKKYERRETLFSMSYTSKILGHLNATRLYVIGLLIAITTCVSILGLLKAQKRQSRISTRRKKGQKGNGTGQNGGYMYDHVVEMCVLQLCLAIPAVVNYVLLATMKISGLEKTYLIGHEALARKMQYADAIRDIDLYGRYFVLKSTVLTTHYLAHTFHFYLYLLFCASIRQSFFNALIQCKNKILRKDIEAEYRRANNI